MARPSLAPLLVLLLLGAAGCPAGGDDEYPIGVGVGGGGTSGTGTLNDAGGGDGGVVVGPGQLAGRVCLLTDLRRLTGALPADCATTGANDLGVRLGGGTPVLTAADGSFVVAEQAGTNLLWTVDGATLVTSVIPVSASRLLPAIRDTDYGDLIAANPVLISPGEGSIIARLVRNNAPLVGATAAVVGGESLQTLYDGPSATVWGTLATGSLGVAWLPDNVAGARTLSITPAGGTPFTVPVTIVDQGITFVTIAVP